MRYQASTCVLLPNPTASHMLAVYLDHNGAFSSRPSTKVHVEMKVMITGVAGFIGSNLAQALLDKSYEVIGIDNMSQGSTLNLAAFARHPRFTLAHEDIRNEAAVLRLAEGCD